MTEADANTLAADESETRNLEAKKQAFDLWAKSEDIAMHFNDLAMRLRLQALAGVGASTLIAGGISTHQGQVDLRIVGYFLCSLSPVWVGIWVLDVYYYQALLHGAVASIVKLEQNSGGRFHLSTSIGAEVASRGRRARFAFYSVIGVLLLVGGLLLIGTSNGHPPAPEPACLALCRDPNPRAGTPGVSVGSQSAPPAP